MFNARKYRIISRESLTREVAERSIPATLQSLSADADNMPEAELRGYVRAYALPLVRDESMQLVSREWPAEALEELISAALERTTHLVVTHLRQPAVVAMPAPHVRLRLAA